jgi:lipopolysaccharide assembly outer membrane protein LptD (OstA)
MYGKFTNDDRINIILDDVLGYLNLKNGEIIFLKSNNAKYNTLTGDSNFYGNVNSNYLNHEMNSDYLDVFFENKKLEAYGNLIYTNNEYKLTADKAILDFITKNLEIFMLDDTQVKVININ